MANTPKTDFTLRFNGFDLGTIPYLGFARRLVNDEATREIISFNLVEAPGRIVTGVDVGDKPLIFDGWIDAPNRALYEEALRQLSFYTQGVEKTLDFEQAGRGIRFQATRGAIRQTPIQGGKATIRLQMIASRPYGYDLFQDSVAFDFESLVANDGVELDYLFQGTADAAPKFRITLHDITDGENKSITISNPLTGSAVTVAGNFADGDVVELDSDTVNATVNGEIRPTTGVFPEFRPLTERSFYNDTFAARSVTIEVIYRRRYS